LTTSNQTLQKSLQDIIKKNTTLQKQHDDSTFNYEIEMRRKDIQIAELERKCSDFKKKVQDNQSLLDWQSSYIEEYEKEIMLLNIKVEQLEQLENS